MGSTSGRVRTTHLLSEKSYWCVLRTLLSVAAIIYQKTQKPQTNLGFLFKHYQPINRLDSLLVLIVLDAAVAQCSQTAESRL